MAQLSPRRPVVQGPAVGRAQLQAGAWAPSGGVRASHVTGPSFPWCYHANRTGRRGARLLPEPLPGWMGCWVPGFRISRARPQTVSPDQAPSRAPETPGRPTRQSGDCWRKAVGAPAADGCEPRLSVAAGTVTRHTAAAAVAEPGLCR